MTAEFFSRWCGPAALASATGQTRIEAAQDILDIGRGSRSETRGACRMDALGTALGKPVKSLRQWNWDPPLPTVARWLRENRREAIIRAANHFMHVKGGRIIEANGYSPRRGRVTHVIFLSE